MEDFGGSGVKANGFEWAVTVAVEVRKEGDVWLAACPGLHVGSHGKTEAEARAMLREALNGFFECCAETGAFRDAIEEPGVTSAFPVAGAVAGGTSHTERVPEMGKDEIPVPIPARQGHAERDVRAEGRSAQSGDRTERFLGLLKR